MSAGTMLGELIEAASGSDVPVDELLRRLKVVSARAGLPELEGWVQHELSGYPDSDTAPDYRGPFGVVVLGHLTGPFGQQVKNYPIPPVAYPEDLREGRLWNVWLLDGVASLEELASRDGAIQFAWPPDMMPYTRLLQAQGKCSIDPSLVLVTAIQVLDRSKVVGVLRDVRDRVLTLALRLEADNPSLGEPGGPKVGSGAGRDIRIIMKGGTANFAVASSNVTQTATGQKVNVDRLIDEAREAGVQEDDLIELRAAVEDDSKEPHEGIGPQTQGWLARWSGKAVGAAGTATVGVVTRIILQHFGIGS